MSMKSSITLMMVGAVWFMLVLGCKLPQQPPQPRRLLHGCVTPDNSFARVVGDDAYLIDLKTKEIKRRIEQDVFFNTVLCAPNNDVIAISTVKAVWLNKDKEIRGDLTDAASSIGFIDGDTLVGAYQPIFHPNQMDEKADPIVVIFASLDPNRQAPSSFRLFNLTSGDIGKERYLRESAIRLLTDGRMLLAGGSYADTALRKACVWSLFTLRLNTKSLESFGDVKKGDLTLCIGKRDGGFESTADGKVIAAVFGEAPAQERILDIFESGKELSRIPIKSVSAAHGLALNKDGSRVAAGWQLSADNSYQVYLLDTHSGSPLWRIPIPAQSNYLEFLDDNSLLVLTDNGFLSRRNGETGASSWEIKLVGSKE